MKRFYFWYSEKQRKTKGLSFNPTQCFVDIGGEIKEYTECRIGTKEPTGLWDDYIYLGSIREKDFSNFVTTKTIK